MKHLPTVLKPAKCRGLTVTVAHALEVEGEFWECGVYLGGSATRIAELIPNRRLRLFDSFEGLPKPGVYDNPEHVDNFKPKKRALARRNIKAALRWHKHWSLHDGWMPRTFEGLEDCKIAFAHIDVDIWRSHVDCMNFIWPRLVSGGFMLFDDFGNRRDWPGATIAINSFAAEVGLRLETEVDIFGPDCPTTKFTRLRKP